MIKPHYEPVVCKDGFRMSVQAGKRNYCSPRDDVGPYTAVEVGSISHYDIHLHEYAEAPERPTDTVYGWVPTVVLQLCIESHGGIVSGELPPRVKTEVSSDFRRS